MFGVLFVETGGGDAFDLVDEFGDGDFGWDGDDHVYLILDAAESMDGGLECMGFVTQIAVNDGFYLGG